MCEVEEAFFHIADLGGELKLARELLYGEIKTPTKKSSGRPHNDSDTIIMPERGATTANTVARLKRDDPELAERVVNGEVTPNAAAREKGWRKPREGPARATGGGMELCNAITQFRSCAPGDRGRD